MRTLFVTYRGTATDRFDREYFVNTHLPLARGIAEPLGMLSIEALFPTIAATNIVAACVIELREEQAERDLFSSPRFSELVNDLPNYTNLLPEQSLVAHLSA